MNIHFYVDTENVQADWKAIIKMLQPGDSVHLFTSMYTGWEAQSYAVPKGVLVYEHQCEVGGKNALDFQLTSYFASNAQRHPECAHIIIAYDQGYEFAVKPITGAWRAAWAPPHNHEMYRKYGWIRSLRGFAQNGS